MATNEVEVNIAVQPLISVIVPVYRVEKYIHRCVDSIIKQTYANLEIILIDDGSPDKSGEICDEYAKKDARVKVIHQKNAGVSAARNAGLDICTGDYIAFVDSDDYVESSLFSKCALFIEKYNPDLLDWGFMFVDENEQTVRMEHHILPKCVLIEYEKIASDIIPQLIHVHYRDSSYLGAWIWNKLFKKTIVVDNNLKFDNDIRMWEDGIFTIEYLKYCKNMISLSDAFYYYRNSPNSLSTKYDPNLYKYAITIYNKYRSMYSPEYDFNNKVSKGYRFQLAHGLIMRTLDLVEKAIINNKEAESNICEMLSDKEFVNFFTSEYHKNPFILFAQIASVLKIPKISLMSYKLYRKIKSKI